MKRKQRIKIGNRLIGEGKPVFVIAEIGSNHNRDLGLAKRMIREIGRAGADAVKFQTFKADLLVNKRFRPQVYDLLRRNELPREWHGELKKCAEKNGLVFLSTPFDREAVDLLRKLRVAAYKVASGDITDLPLIRYMARFGKPMIVSVGAADDGMIKAAIDAIRKEGNDRIVICQCVVRYPADHRDANVRVLGRLKDRFKTLVGYSDHSPEEMVPIMAVAQGATVIEKHVTLSRSMKGPDHSFALEMHELKNLVNKIRRAEGILGNEVKRILPSERRAASRARRSIYAIKRLKSGARIKASDLINLRPKVGIDSARMGILVGRRVKKNINVLDPIYLRDLK